MKIAVICPSEIALRRFMPALQLIDEVEFVGIGVSSKEERFAEDVEEEVMEQILSAERKKADEFVQLYGGRVFDSYEEVVSAADADAVYIPLPPALHYRWAKKALENGKHVLVEKPSTISPEDTAELISIAKEKGLALHENYMFIFHEQLDAIEDTISCGEIGDVRLFRICFGFPMRQANDFRYNKALGGGALIDAGGYTLKYATRLLGQTAQLKSAQMNYIDGFEVDMYGSAMLVNEDGQTAHVAFGMDNNYKCELEVWGSKGTLSTGRVLTAPAGFEPTMTIRKGNIDEERMLPADDAFKKSILHFLSCVKDKKKRMDNYDIIQKQADLVEEFFVLSSKQ